MCRSGEASRTRTKPSRRSWPPGRQAGVEQLAWNASRRRWYTFGRRGSPPRSRTPPGCPRPTGAGRGRAAPGSPPRGPRAPARERRASGSDGAGRAPTGHGRGDGHAGGAKSADPAAVSRVHEREPVGEGQRAQEAPEHEREARRVVAPQRGPGRAGPGRAAGRSAAAATAAEAAAQNGRSTETVWCSSRWFRQVELVGRGEDHERREEERRQPLQQRPRPVREPGLAERGDVAVNGERSSVQPPGAGRL